MAQHIFRYDEAIEVFTALDPLADIISWVRGLRSVGYVCDLLAEKRDFSSANETREAGRAIASHAEIAVGFLEQAFSGKTELSFLPIYYGLANLSKVLIIADGRIAQLRKQQLHGATWSGIQTRSQDLNTDHISLMERGVIPLLYKTLTGSIWSSTAQKDKNGRWISTPKRKVSMRNVYPYITPISFEYQHAYGGHPSLLEVSVVVEHRDGNRARLEIDIGDSGFLPNTTRSHYKLLTGLKKEGNKYVSKTITYETPTSAAKTLRGLLRHHLIYSDTGYSSASDVDPRCRLLYYRSFTPASNSTLLLPEEFPILLAFYHLSNVVRYDPNRLLRLFDSHAAGLLEVLVKQGTYRFLLLFWSNLMQTTYFFP